MTDPLTTALLFCLIPALVFLLCAWYINRNAEHIRFLQGFQENRRERPRDGFLALLITQPDNNRVWGVDVSGRWDGLVNWVVTRSRGASFAIVKCTEGTVNTRLFVENVTAAIKAGLIGGAYHWLHRNSVVSCKAQALAAWNRIKLFPKLLPLVIDLESTKWNGQSSNPTYADVELFTDEFIRLSGRKPILYSSPGFLASLGPIPASLLRKLAGVHIAHYGVVKPSFDNWLFWQFSPEGDATLITPNDYGKLEVDLNYYRGDLQSLYALAGGDPDPLPEPPKEETMQYKFTYSPFTKERTTPDANSVTNLTGNVYYADAVVNVLEIVDEGVNKWFKLDNGRYAAYIYNGTTRAVPVTPAPVPDARFVLTKRVLEIEILDTETGKRWGVTVDDGTQIDFREM